MAIVAKNIIEEIHFAAEAGYQITIEVSGMQMAQYADLKDPEDRPYYVNLFLGDSNGPHKPGTLLGIGYGFTLEEAWRNADDDLRHPLDRK